MNEKKQKQLFAAARASAAAEPPSNFPVLVLGAITNASHQRSTPSTSVLDQLANLFPQLAPGALAVMAVAVILGFYLGDDLTSQLAQVSNEWLLPVDWL